MSNGAQCCALEICCNSAESNLRTAQFISISTGMKLKYCNQFLEWMNDEGLTFAPLSVKPFIKEIAEITRNHGSNKVPDYADSNKG